MTKGVNSPAPTTAEVVGGVYNATPPVLQDGQATALQVDVNGKLITSGSGGGTQDINIKDVSGAVPALNNPLPVELSDGTNAFGTAGNPLSVNVLSGGGSNASVGTTGAAAPASATEIGWIDGTGKLQPSSAANPLPVTIPVTSPVSVIGHMETSTSAAVWNNATAQNTTAVLINNEAEYNTINIVLITTSTITGGTVIFEASMDGSVWQTIPTFNPLSQTIYNAQYTLVQSTNNYFVADVTGWTYFRVRLNNAITGTGALTIQYVKDALPQSANVQVNGNVSINNIPGAGSPGTGVPGSALYEGINVGGTIRGATGVNPTGVVYAQQEDIASWGGTAVQAAQTASTDGTGANQIVRSIERRYGSILTTTPLAGGGVYTSSWFDTNQTGAHFVGGFVTTDVALNSVTNGFQIQGTNDTAAGAPFPILVLGSGSATSKNTLWQTVMPYRYWRIVVTNGASAMASFEVTALESSIPLQIVVTQTIKGQLVVSPVIGSASTGGFTDNAQFLATTSNTDGTAAIPVSVSAYLTAGAGGSGATTALNAARTPSIFKTASAAASGNTAVWTPTSGKKFRLMRFMVQVTGNSTTASGVVVTISFQDSASAMNIAMDVFVPTTSLGTGDDFVGPWVDLGNGFLSAAANNVLNINLSAALATGNVRVTCCGTEE